MSAADTLTLPALRADLEILAGTPDTSGTPSFVIHDPLQHRYFQIDLETRKLLSAWSEGLSIDELARASGKQASADGFHDDVARLLQFLRTNNLISQDRPDAWRDLHQKAGKEAKPWVSRLLRGYLFFRIPLAQPQQMLEALLPHLNFLFARQTLLAICAIGLAGLYLVSRQWDLFLGSFAAVFSLKGSLSLIFFLVLLKIAHEMGHALTAARFGCRVPTMGIAFMLMFPLFYTDVSDAWRLPSRRQRMLISAAGVLVEMALAMIATFLWTFLPPGYWRDIAFMIATSGWIMSLGFNLNPFMKFDGYYIFSEMLGIDNLQPRSFAFGRWKLRQMLFMPSLQPPEQLPRSTQSILVAYAWATWLYRLIAFTAIAVLAYTFTFKLLGIVLFVAEIWMLVVRPIVNEIRQWTELTGSDLSKARTRLTVGLVLVALAFLVLPWSTRVEIPSVLSAADLVQLYPSRPAKVAAIHVHRNQQIAEGGPLIELTSPELDSDINHVKIELDQERLRLSRALLARQNREGVLVIQQKIAQLQTSLDGLMTEKQQLTIRSPRAGTVLEINADLHAGRWISKDERLGLIKLSNRLVVKGYVEETDLTRLTRNASGRFIADDPTRKPIPVKVVRVDLASAPSVDISELASTNGGGIAVTVDARQRAIPTTAQYLVELTPQTTSGDLTQVVRGVVLLDGSAESFASRLWRQILRVLVRESGF